MRFRRKRASLVDRLRPCVDTGPPPEPMVSADPIRMFLYRWVIETGDPIEVVAKGFGLDENLVISLVDGEVARISGDEQCRLCERLGLDPT